MSNTTYIALSRQMVLRAQLDSIAQNIANASTAGYKGRHVYFVEYLTRPQQSEPLSYVSTLDEVTNFAEGPLLRTGNELDLALHGEGFYAVDTGTAVRYTRDGSFTLDPDGQLVTKAGHLVLDRGGRPILVPADSGAVTVSPDGTLSGIHGVLGQLKVVRFEDPNALVPVGSGLFASNAPELPAETYSIRQGMVEGANVEPIVEMTRMIDVLRTYQSVQRILQDEHDLERQAIQKLTRVS